MNAWLAHSIRKLAFFFLFFRTKYKTFTLYTIFQLSLVQKKTLWMCIYIHTRFERSSFHLCLNTSFSIPIYTNIYIIIITTSMEIFLLFYVFLSIHVYLYVHTYTCFKSTFTFFSIICLPLYNFYVLAYS